MGKQVQLNRIRPTIRELNLKHYNKEKNERGLSDTDLFNEILHYRYFKENISEVNIVKLSLEEYNSLVDSISATKKNAWDNQRLIDRLLMALHGKGLFPKKGTPENEPIILVSLEDSGHFPRG